MNSSFKVVLDTNTLISAAILKDSLPAKVFDIALIQCRIIFSGETLIELYEVIYRKKFNKYITNFYRDLFLNKFLIHSYELIKPTTEITDCRDPKDNKFLQLAIDGNADYIISGDKDLLQLHPYKNIPIIPPAQFLEILTHEVIKIM